MSWTDELIEFEFAARTVVVGDAEAYGRSLGEPEVDLRWTWMSLMKSLKTSRMF